MFNVLIKGYSIGLTPSLSIAQEWYKESLADARDKKIVRMKP